MERMSAVDTGVAIMRHRHRNHSPTLVSCRRPILESIIASNARSTVRGESAYIGRFGPLRTAQDATEIHTWSTIEKLKRNRLNATKFGITQITIVHLQPLMKKFESQHY